MIQRKLYPAQCTSAVNGPLNMVDLDQQVNKYPPAKLSSGPNQKPNERFAHKDIYVQLGGERSK